MSYQQEIEKYIGKHKNLIAKLMKVSPKDISTSDLRIFANFLSYRAGESHFYQNGGKVDPRFIDDIRIKSRELKGPHALLDAISWYERGVLSRGSLTKVFRDQNKFSPKIEKYLESRRKENYKKAFNTMANSVNSLRKTVSDLTTLMNDGRSLHDKDYVREIKQTMTRLRGDLSRCDYHARAGIAWAVKSGIPFDHAKKGIETVYLRHLDQNILPGMSSRTGEKHPTLAEALAPLDELLSTQGIYSSISKHIEKRMKDWNTDLLLARFELQQQKQPVTREQKKVFEQANIPTLTAPI